MIHTVYQRPYEAQAVQWDGTNVVEVAEFVGKRPEGGQPAVALRTHGLVMWDTKARIWLVLPKYEWLVKTPVGVEHMNPVEFKARFSFSEDVPDEDEEYQLEPGVTTDMVEPPKRRGRPPKYEYSPNDPESA